MPQRPIARAARGRLSRIVRAVAVAATGAALAAAPERAGAQILRIDGPREPFVWVSGGIGYRQFGRSVFDGRSNTVWNFGSGLEYRASVEKSIAHQSGIGISASYGRMPLRFYDQRLTTSAGESDVCFDLGRGCKAHAQVSSLGLTFHTGGGGRSAVFQVIEASAGVTRYANFEESGTGAKLLTDANLDASLTVGYGIGYSLSRAVQIALVQDYAAVLHEKSGLPSGASAVSPSYITRLTVRLGAGSRRQGL